MQPQRSQDAPRNLSEELVDLQNLDVTSLKHLWRRLYGTEPPAKISRLLLLLAVAYRLQEQTLGGLRSSTRRLLERVAQERDGRPSSKPTVNRLSPGTVRSLVVNSWLIRWWGFGPEGQSSSAYHIAAAFDYSASR